MNLIEGFIEGEKSKCNRFDKLFKNYPVFYKINDIEFDLKINNRINESFVVRPSKIKRFIALIYICLGLFLWSLMLLFIIDKTLLPITILFLLMLTVWIWLIFWSFFLNSNKSFEIWMDKEKIKIGKHTYVWQEVSEYLLMEKGGGKYLVTTLVLFINNKANKYDVTNLDKSGKEILKRIDFYKYL